MQEVIKNSNMTIKEFSNYYEIPYNTVREWHNGNLKAPNWVVKLFKENAELNCKGNHLFL